MLSLAFAESSIQLVPDGTMILHLAVVIVMVALLNATLLKPINRILEEREQLTKGRLSEAQRVMLKIDDQLREYERRLREARAEGYALIEQERSRLSRERGDRIGEIKCEIAGEVSGQREKLGLEIVQVKANLQRNLLTTALEISRHILHRPIAQPNNTGEI